MASLFKRPTGYYYLSFTDSKRKPRCRQIALGTKVKREAERKKIDLEARRAKTEQVKQGMMQALLTGRTRLVGAEAAAG